MLEGFPVEAPVTYDDSEGLGRVVDILCGRDGPTQITGEIVSNASCER